MNEILIGKIQPKDIKEITKIHLEVFSSFFLSSLGPRFIKTYYHTFLKHPKAICFCAKEKLTGEVLGFIFSCETSKGFHKSLVLRNILKYLLLALMIIFTNPKKIIRLLQNFEKKKMSKDSGEYSEILSIGVSKKHGGKGIGGILLETTEKALLTKGVNTITLTTDKLSNDKVLAFYARNGYSLYYSFESFPNRQMVKLIKNI